MSWPQLSETFQNLLTADITRWESPLAATSGGKDGPLPPWLHAPWVLETSEVKSGNNVVWHEVRRADDGMVLARGYGPAPSATSSSSSTSSPQWSISEDLALLEEARVPTCPVVGFSEDGRRCARGPYWAVCAPRLAEIVTGREPAGVNQTDHELGKASSYLVHWSRQRAREHSDSGVDYLEVFNQTPYRRLLQRDGLVLPAKHEDFTKESGWCVDKRTHRRRLQALLSSPGEPESPLQPRTEDVRVYFMLDVVGDSVTLAGASAWKDVVKDPVVSVITWPANKGNPPRTIVTNSAWISKSVLDDYDLLGKRSGRLHNISPGDVYYHSRKPNRQTTLLNQRARELREKGDFSSATCLALVKESGEVARRRTRQASREATRPLKSQPLLYGLRDGPDFLEISRIALEQPFFVVERQEDGSATIKTGLCGNRSEAPRGPASILTSLGFGRHEEELEGDGVSSSDLCLLPALRHCQFEGSYHHFPQLFLSKQVWATTTNTAAEEDEENDEAPSTGTVAPAATSAPAPKVSESQVALIRKLHVNTGHLPRDRFLRTLKSAGALPHVLQYVRDEFRCPECEVKKNIDPRRKAQCPRIFGFNKALSIDIFYLKFNGASVPFLNMVCSGTNYQVVQRVSGNSQGTRPQLGRPFFRRG